MRRKFVTVDVLHITRFYWRPARPDARSQRLENGSSGESPVSSNHAETVFVPEQSPEMGRQSFNRLTVTTKHRQLVSAAISGDAIVVSEAIIDA